MKPLNYAILKYFTTVEEASVNNVMEDLKDDYKSLRTFNKNEIKMIILKFSIMLLKKVRQQLIAI